MRRQLLDAHSVEALTARLRVVRAERERAGSAGRARGAEYAAGVLEGAAELYSSGALAMLTLRMGEALREATR